MSTNISVRPPTRSAARVRNETQQLGLRLCQLQFSAKADPLHHTTECVTPLTNLCDDSTRLARILEDLDREVLLINELSAEYRAQNLMTPNMILILDRYAAMGHCIAETLRLLTSKLIRMQHMEANIKNAYQCLKMAR